MINMNRRKTSAWKGHNDRVTQTALRFCCHGAGSAHAELELHYDVLIPDVVTDMMVMYMVIPDVVTESSDVRQVEMTASSWMIDWLLINFEDSQWLTGRAAPGTTVFFADLHQNRPKVSHMSPGRCPSNLKWHKNSEGRDVTVRVMTRRALRSARLAAVSSGSSSGRKYVDGAAEGGKQPRT